MKYNKSYKRYMNTLDNTETTTDETHVCNYTKTYWIDFVLNILQTTLI